MKTVELLAAELNLPTAELASALASIVKQARQMEIDSQIKAEEIAKAASIEAYNRKIADLQLEKQSLFVVEAPAEPIKP